LEEERKQHQIEVESVRSQFAIQFEKLHDSIKRKSDRIKQLKAKIAEINDEFTMAFENEKQIVQSLRQKYEREIASKTASETALLIQVKTLQSENSELRRKAEEQIARCEKARDSFWKSKLSLAEEEFQKRMTTVVSPKRQMKTDKKTLEVLSEWENWAKRTYANVNHGEIFRENSRALRLRLSELLLDSVNQRGVSAKLKSLRDQKLILLRHQALEERSDEEPSFRTVLIIGLAITRLLHDIAKQ
jgi:hypothetical protein